MYLFYEQVTATNAVKTLADLAIPANTTHVMLQAGIQNVRYTMDNVTNPTQTAGMVLIVGLTPEQFSIDNLQRIRFVRGAGSDGVLSLHYWAGRDV